MFDTEDKGAARDMFTRFLVDWITDEAIIGRLYVAACWCGLWLCLVAHHILRAGLCPDDNFSFLGEKH